MVTQQTTPAPVKGKAARKPKTHQVAAGTAKKLEGGKEEVSNEQREAERRHSDENERRQVKADAAMAFAVQQMTTPVSILKTPPAATEEFQAELKKLMKQHGVEEVPGQVLKNEKLVRNGITRPGSSTITGKVWAAADRITAHFGRPAAIAELKHDNELRGINDHTVKTQFSRWRQFNSIKGRQQDFGALPAKVMDHEGNP